MSDTTERTTLRILAALGSPLTPGAARAWLGSELPRWLDALKSAALAGRRLEVGANAACVLIDDLGDVITACASALDSHEPVEILGAEDREEPRRVLADLLHMLLTHEANSDGVGVFDPSHPALLVSERLASLSG